MAVLAEEEGEEEEEGKRSRPLAGVKQTSARKSRCIFEGGGVGGEGKNRTTVYISGTRAWPFAWNGRRKAAEKARWDDAYYRVNNVYTRQTAVDEINGLSDTISVPVLFLLPPSSSSFFFFNQHLRARDEDKKSLSLSLYPYFYHANSNLRIIVFFFFFFSLLRIEIIEKREETTLG